MALPGPQGGAPPDDAFERNFEMLSEALQASEPAAPPGPPAGERPGTLPGVPGLAAPPVAGSEPQMASGGSPPLSAPAPGGPAAGAPAAGPPAPAGIAPAGAPPAPPAPASGPVRAPGPGPPGGGKKRGPGRPSKTPAPPSIPYHGVASTPAFPQDILEVCSSVPLAWKSLFQFFDRLKVEQIFLQADQAGIQIYTVDGSEKLRIRANIEGKRLNHYYCSQRVALNINHAHLSKIFSNISRNFHLLQLFYQRDDPSNLTISLTDVTLNKSHFFPVRVSPVTPESWWGELDRQFDGRDESQVVWTVPTHAFKKSHEIATQTATSVKVELVGGGCLNYKYIGNGAKEFSEVYSNSDKIKLQTRLEPGEVFMTSYSAAAGKTLSSSIPADSVTVYCTAGQPLLFVSEEENVGIGIMAVLAPT